MASHPRKRDAVLISVGGAIFLFGLITAFFWHYNHFYEIFLIGLFLILRGLNGEKSIKRALLVQTYLIFIMVGFLGDYGLGIRFANLWHYSYTHLIEYVALYTVIYPLGGLVLVQTFELLKQEKERREAFSFVNVNTGFVLLLVALNIFYGLQEDLWRYSIFSVIFFFSFVVLNYFSEYRFQDSFLRRWNDRPYENTLIIVVVTLFHAILHEYPNLFVHQWMYHNFPLMAVDFAGIPLFVLMGWFALSLIPLSIYYDRKISLQRGT